jgi:hypothetical protein
LLADPSEEIVRVKAMNTPFDVAASGIEVDGRSYRNRSKNFKVTLRAMLGITEHTKKNISPKRNASHVPLRYVK